MWNLKSRNQTVKVRRNGYVFQVDPDNPFVRFFGGGGTEFEQYDPYAGTGVRDLYSQLSEILSGQMGQGITPYGGQIVPGASQLQQQGFGLAQGLGPLATGAGQFFGDVLGQQAAGGGQYQQLAGQGIQDIMQPWDPASATQMWETAFKAPAMQTWQQDVIPSIMERYAGQGAADSGAMGRTLARSGQELTTGLGGQLAQLLYGGQQAHLGRQQTGVGQAMGMAALPGQIAGQAGQVGGMGTDILSQMLNIGGQQRGIAGEQLGEPYMKYQQSQPWANPYLLNFLGAGLGQPPMGTIAQQQGPSWSSMLPSMGSCMGGLF